MLIEFVKDKKEGIYVIKNREDYSVLSHCIVCLKDMRDERSYKAICDACGKSRTMAERIEIWKNALLCYPELCQTDITFYSTT